MIEIDGSFGEGGGQILRSALTLSLLRQSPFKITSIRKNRPQPGLRQQHLVAIKAAASISNAIVEGASLGSTEISFIPGSIRSGKYRFSVPTAGSTSLIFQTIGLPLSLASATSSIMISGGTHVPYAPCFHYLSMHWLPYLQVMGFDFQINLDSAGFYPEGGGRMTAIVRPAKEIKSLKIVFQHSPTQVVGISAVANLDREIGVRQKRQALRRLQSRFSSIHIRNEKLKSKYKGTFIILITANKDDGYAQSCFFALGEKGKPAELVANQAVDDLFTHLKSNTATDPYLVDQLLIPFTLASGESYISTSCITSHIITNLEIIKKFFPINFELSGSFGKPGKITIEGMNYLKNPITQ